MALDFSKFTLAAPDVSGIAKIPEYAALAAKAAKGDTGFKQLESIFNPKNYTIQDTEGFITGKQRDEVNGQLMDALTVSKNYLDQGYDLSTVLLDARNKAATIKKTADGLSAIGVGYTQGIENTYGKIPGFNLQNSRSNFMNYITHTKDENGNIVETPINPNIINANTQDNLSTIMNPMIYDNNWDQGGVTDVFKKAKGNTITQNVRVRKPDGSETMTDITTDVPLNIFDVVDDGKGNKSFVVKKEDYVPVDLGTIKKDDLSSVYHNTLGDNITGAVQLVPEKTYNDFMNVEGIKYYVQQEQAKFEKNLINQGVQTRDPKTGQLIPEVEAEINKFGRAAMHDAFDNNAAIVGGTKTKTATAKLAPLPKPITNINVYNKKEQDTRDRDATFGTWNNLWANRPTGVNTIDVKDQIAGLADASGRPLSKRPKVELSKESGKWVIKVYKNDPATGNPIIDQTYDLKNFRANTKSVTTEENRTAAHTYLEDWTSDIDKALNATKRKK